MPLLALFGAVLLLLSGCGGSASTSQPKNVDVQLRTCLEKAGQGSSLEDVEVRRNADPTFAKALDGCQANLGLEPGNKTDAASTEGASKQLLGTLTCLRDKGWNVPQPTRGANGYLGVPGELNENVPPEQQGAFLADLQRCGGPGAGSPQEP